MTALPGTRRAAWLGALAATLGTACHHALQPKVDQRGARETMELARVALAAGQHVPRPLTRAERTHYTETSRLTDVYTFLDSLAKVGAPIVETVMGKSAEGADLPLIIAARPVVHTPAEARATGKPIVFVQANIHAGEVEGKEALQMVLRDLTLDARPNAIDSIILLAVPIYNADGNERIAPQTINRTEQNGPVLVGTRANAQNLNLNRDYIKAEAPETRAALAAFAQWDPDLFVDLHTTDGSFHGYALTYSPSLHPGAPLAAYNQDTLLPALQRRVRDKWQFATFPYGNFAREESGRASLTDTLKRGWQTYEHLPRYGTNYYGLRGKLSVLSEAFSHDPFERRVSATYAFVRELLSMMGEQGPAIVARTRTATTPRNGVLRSRLTATPYTGPVIAEDLVRGPDSTAISQPGVPRGLQRTGRYRTIQMPIYDRFDATLRRAVPGGGWAFDSTQSRVVALLRLHGMRVERFEAPVQADAEVFRADSVVRAPRAFEGHNEERLEGTWRTERRQLGTHGYFVPADQPLALVALDLLEPQSDDGLATWNFFDPQLAPGRDFPVVRLTAKPAETRTPVP